MFRVPVPRDFNHSARRSNSTLQAQILDGVDGSNSIPLAFRGGQLQFPWLIEQLIEGFPIPCGKATREETKCGIVILPGKDS